MRHDGDACHCGHSRWWAREYICEKTPSSRGSDRAAEHSPAVASLIEACKLNDVEPLRYLADSPPGSPTATRTVRMTSFCLGLHRPSLA